MLLESFKNMINTELFVETDKMDRKEFESVYKCKICEGVVIDPVECKSCEMLCCKKCVDGPQGLNCPYKCTPLPFKNFGKTNRHMLAALNNQ